MADEQQQQQPPIIIKRINKGHGGHHGGAWKVAFADFMTAMMAFFLVMWAVGQSAKVKEAIGGYFRDPGKYMIEGSSGILKGSRGIIPAADPSIGKRKNPPEQTSGPTDAEKSSMQAAGLQILRELKKHQAFNRLENNIKVQLTGEGLRIILNESANSPAFFEPGSAKLLQKSAIILMTIARELGNLTNRLVIEGHTDAAFSGGKNYGNWDLSTDRANAARELMEVSGVRENQIREVRGFADQFPMIVSDPFDARNRRITIVVLYRWSELRYEQLEVGEDLMDQIDTESAKGQK